MWLQGHRLFCMSVSLRGHGTSVSRNLLWVNTGSGTGPSTPSPSVPHPRGCRPGPIIGSGKAGLPTRDPREPHPLQVCGPVLLPLQGDCVAVLLPAALTCPLSNSVWGQSGVLCCGAGCSGCLGKGAAPGPCHLCGQLLDGTSQAAKSQTCHHWGHQVRPWGGSSHHPVTRYPPGAWPGTFGNPPPLCRGGTEWQRGGGGSDRVSFLCHTLGTPSLEPFSLSSPEGTPSSVCPVGSQACSELAGQCGLLRCHLL